MKRILNYLLLICTLHLLACSSENLQEKMTLFENDEISTIGASISSFEMDNAESRVSISMGKWPNFGDVLWAEGDTIGIYPSEGDQLSFPIVEGIGKNYCEFNGGGWALKTSTSYTAYTPFNRNYYLYKKNDALPVSMLNQKQIGNNNSNHVGAYDIQIAKGTTPTDGKISFSFQHQVSFVRMDLIAPCPATWKSITLKSDGVFTTKANMDLSLETPTLTATLQTNAVTLDLENVNTNDSLHIVAYMMMLPIDFTDKTLEVILTDVDDNIYTAPATIVNNKFNFTAASARWINAEFEETNKIDDPTPYVTFNAGSPQTLTMSQAVETLEYSVNNGDWMELGTSTIQFGDNLGSLRLRGKSSIGTATTMTNSKILFGNEVPVSCSGDIRTLIDYEIYKSVNTKYARFTGLFKNCYQMISAPELPATELATYCYLNMFDGCTSLSNTPELPATLLNSDCYRAMFKDCTNLLKTPELPATILASNCYQDMFNGCTSLSNPPKLPATTLASNCYNGMFKNCTSLINTPELPATTLTSNCYQDMFSNCSSLSTTSELPATTLASDCYNGMFSDCTNLTITPELPATILASNCYYRMFSGCIKLSTTSNLPATLLAENCYYRMFYNCIKLTNAPELPATTLSKYCYYQMFYNCGLTTAPKLSANNLSDYCYYQMFSNCTKLTTAPDLPALTLKSHCYYLMFENCTNLTMPPQLSATTLAPYCCSGMFSGCKNLTSTPRLVATILVESCYSAMFSGCTKLNKIIMLATDVSADYCLGSWLWDVSSDGTFYKNSNVEDTANYGIPPKWTILNYQE